MKRQTWFIIGRIFTYLSLCVIVILSLFPLFWMFLTSFKPKYMTFATPPVWFFKPTTENYAQVFLFAEYPKYFANSMIVGLATTIIAVTVGSLAAYAFARFEFRGRNTIQVLMLIPQIIPPVAIIIPLFVLFRTLNLTDKLGTLVFSYLSFAIPIAVWILIGFFRDVPRDLEEAALIDGATHWQALWKVLYPLVTPGLAAAAILIFIGCWNEFLYAVILTGRDSKTVPVAIASFISNKDIHWGRIAAAGTVMLLPVTAFALSVQRYLVQGLSKGAIKG
jgi:multiple sugar transport system permease protein